jgi:hypothetical protein
MYHLEFASAGRSPVLLFSSNSCEQMLSRSPLAMGLRLLVVSCPEHHRRYPMASASGGRSPLLRFCSNSCEQILVSFEGRRKSARLFKELFCDDISEFESSQPSQSVSSLWIMSGLQKAGFRRAKCDHLGGRLRA